MARDEHVERQRSRGSEKAILREARKRFKEKHSVDPTSAHLGLASTYWTLAGRHLKGIGKLKAAWYIWKAVRHTWDAVRHGITTIAQVVTAAPILARAPSYLGGDSEWAAKMLREGLQDMIPKHPHDQGLAHVLYAEIIV